MSQNYTAYIGSYTFHGSSQGIAVCDVDMENGQMTAVSYTHLDVYKRQAKDILTKGCLDPKKCCVTCSKCTELMRSVAPAGCVVRDSEAYICLLYTSRCV